MSDVAQVEKASAPGDSGVFRCFSWSCEFVIFGLSSTRKISLQDVGNHQHKPSVHQWSNNAKQRQRDLRMEGDCPSGDPWGAKHTPRHQLLGRLRDIAENKLNEAAEKPTMLKESKRYRHDDTKSSTIRSEAGIRGT